MSVKYKESIKSSSLILKDTKNLKLRHSCITKILKAKMLRFRKLVYCNYYFMQLLFYLNYKKRSM